MALHGARIPRLTVVTMGATMFLEVQNGRAVRSADAERRAIAASIAAVAAADATFGRISGGGNGGNGGILSADDDVDIVSLEQRSGPELTLAGVLCARDAALAAVARATAARAAAAAAAGDSDWRRGPALQDPRAALVAPVVFVTGTDCLEEFALALDYLLPTTHAKWLPPRAEGGDAPGGVVVPPLAVVVTGAMRPASALCPDGPANLADAIAAALDMAGRAEEKRSARGRPGVVVAMGGLLHAARHVRKVCSDGTAGTAFSSGPGAGPVGAVGSGRVTWTSGDGPPPPARLPPGWPGGGTAIEGYSDGEEEEEEDDDDEGGSTRAPIPLVFRVDPARDLRTRVPIWTLNMDAMAPPEALLDAVDGLVLAAPGAGSVAAAVLAELAPAARAKRVPVVLTSRCGAGPNHDAGLYGLQSVAKYERAGFLMGRGDGGAGNDRLSPVQARTSLCVALTLGAAAARRLAERGRAGAQRRKQREAVEEAEEEAMRAGGGGGGSGGGARAAPGAKRRKG